MCDSGKGWLKRTGTVLQQSLQPRPKGKMNLHTLQCEYSLYLTFCTADPTGNDSQKHENVYYITLSGNKYSGVFP